jgi:hypothetical protein
MFTTKHIQPLVIGIALMLAGCGTYVPEIQENPWSKEGERLVQAIAGSIQCELRKAVFDVINPNRDGTNATHVASEADWLKSWGAQVQIQLTVDELGSISPSGSYSPMKIFFLFLGGSVSSEATRIDTLNYYYTVNDILNSGLCDAATIANLPNHPMGSLLIQSDLKLEEWLDSVVAARATGDISITNPIPAAVAQTAKNALSHEVKFQVIASGNITPMWKLVKATINPTGSLLMASRTRTHDLQITFGPNVAILDPTTHKITNSLGLGTPAANASLASQIGLAISNQIINTSLP